MAEYKGLIPERYQDGRGNKFYVFVDPDPSKRTNPGNGKRFDSVELLFGFYKCVDFIKGIPERVASKTVYIDKKNGVLFDDPKYLGIIGMHIINCSNAEQKANTDINAEQSLMTKRIIYEKFKKFAQKSLEDTYTKLIEKAEESKLTSNLRNTLN